MGTNALESYNLVESKGALLNIDAPRPGIVDKCITIMSTQCQHLT